MKKIRRATISRYDLAVIGGGPAGLAFAASLNNLDLRIALVEKNPASVLVDPPDDGREIALTHTSVTILQKLGMMKRIAAATVSPIERARVLNGASPYTLTFDARLAKKDVLGYLVANHRIRKAAYESVKGQKNLDIVTEADVADLRAEEGRSLVTLSDGRVLQASLTVAADGRFSASRRMMGIAAASRDFGRTVVVCRIAHDRPHHRTAYECFHYERTLAILPLRAPRGRDPHEQHASSAVITLSSKDAPALLAMDDAAFNADITARFGAQLGAIRLTGKKYAYPLIGAYADRFYADRFALIGDAAVGMHPVTAHGYNFGLFGGALLADAVRDAHGLGLDIGAPELLQGFGRAYRRATLPLYLGTNFLVDLFTDESAAAKLARHAILRAGNRLAPFKRLVTRHLTATSPAA